MEKRYLGCMKNFVIHSLEAQVRQWLEEDDLTRNFYYSKSLPATPVKPFLKIKSPLILAGVDYFQATFAALGIEAKVFEKLNELEGKSFKGNEVIEFTHAIPFSVAVTGERLALNLLQHASSIATWTAKHVEIANKKNIKLLDTRKTTPGLRSLEKYAVRVGGGYNHRLGQTDSWMIKDNHKSSLGGLAGAWKFFNDQGAFYNSIIVEIHNINELKEAIELGVRHMMLDNFSPEQIGEAVKLKTQHMTFEVSGGINISNLESYLIEGIDAISMGALTYSAPRVDLSFKFHSL